MCRYHLTRELAALGFEATPLSFWHPQYGIVIEYSLRTPLTKHPWIVSISAAYEVRKVGRKNRTVGIRRVRYSDALYAAYAGLRMAGAQDKQPNYYRTGKKL